MNVPADHAHLDAEYRAALDRDVGRDDRLLGQDRCPCGGRTEPTRSTANRQCESCGALIGKAAA